MTSPILSQQISFGNSQYQIPRTLRLRAANSGWLTRTPGSSGNLLKWTLSMWVKRGTLGAIQVLFAGDPSSTNNSDFIGFDSTDSLKYRDTSTGVDLTFTNAVFRDPSAWMNIVYVYDSAQGTQANRGIFYVNGVALSNSTNAIGASRSSTGINVGTKGHGIGRFGTIASNYFDGLIADTYFIDGQALTPSSFGQTDSTTGVWTPLAYTGTYGTNGFHLDFADNSAATAAAIGKDTSGNGNNWTPSGISITAGVTNDSLVDSPTNYGSDTGVGGEVRGNYCTWNPLRETPPLASGNLDALLSTASSYSRTYGTMALPSSGKWYWEITATVGTGQLLVGICNETNPSSYLGFGTESLGYYSSSGNKVTNNAFTAYGNSYATNDVIGVAYDADNQAIYFRKGATWQNSGDPTSGATKTGAAFTTMPSGTLFPAISDADSASTGSAASLNAGQRPFANAAPSGYKALCTQNLPTPAILKPNQYFDATLYTGSASTQGVVNAGAFQPDLVWVKDRASAQDHKLTDSTRGTTKGLISDTTGVETTDANGVTAFNSNGFSLGTGTRSYSDTNADTYVAWQWKKGVTPGFDIVSQTASASGNQTVNHSLGVTPEFAIVKATAGSATNWPVWFNGIGTDHLLLNTTAARSASGYMVSQSSSTFVISVNLVNASNTFVTYLFASKVGFSKFGSYTGNASTDGTFVFTGFRPRFVLMKRTDSTEDWEIVDAARAPTNAAGGFLLPNTSGAEAATNILDILSNGFKMRNSATGGNVSGTYYYAAFAENPFNYSRAR